MRRCFLEIFGLGMSCQVQREFFQKSGQSAMRKQALISTGRTDSLG
jgi:hypothetical protein